MKMLRKAQSTLEYIILVTAVIAAIIAFVPTLRGAVTDTMTSGTSKMTSTAASWSGSLK